VLKDYSIEVEGKYLMHIDDSGPAFMTLDSETCSLCILARFPEGGYSNCCLCYIGPSCQHEYVQFLEYGNPGPMIARLEWARTQYIKQHPEEVKEKQST
jgi:hypothetical protein